MWCKVFGCVGGTAFGHPKAFPQAPSEKEIIARDVNFLNSPLAQGEVGESEVLGLFLIFYIWHVFCF